MQFFAYYLFNRSDQFCTALYCGRLLQELIVDCWVQTESNRLRFIQSHQDDLRADMYKGLADAVDLGLELGEIGQKVVLPSSFPGSPRQLHGLYQDAMAIVATMGKPDLFVTVTSNPSWEEITNALLPGQTHQDRPDLVARVFKLKLSAILDEIMKVGVLGKV